MFTMFDDKLILLMLWMRTLMNHQCYQCVLDLGFQ